MKKNEKTNKVKSSDTAKKRKKAEETLRHSEERYKTILENIEEGYFEVDLAGNLTFFNDTLCRVLGYPREELMGMNNRQYTEKEEFKKVFQAYNKIYKTGEPNREFGQQIIRKNGIKRYIEGSISLLKDSSGRPKGFRGIAHDITERKQAEDLLKQRETQYRLLAYHMKDYVWLMDLNLQWTYISPSGEKLLGYTLKELQQLPLDKLLTATSYKIVMDTFLIRMETILTVPYLETLLELECRCKDGRTLWIESTLSFIRDDNGNPLSILGEGRDITDRKRAEKKLRDEEQRFRAFVEHSSDMIVLVNLEGAITYVNPAIESVLGFKPEERIGAYGFEIVHPDDIKALVDVFNILSKDTNYPVIKGELRLRHKDGSWRTLEAVGSNQINNNVVEYIIINYRDITERKRAEEALRESEQRYRDLSIIDDLTQLYNSRHFYAQLEREIERSNRYGQPLTLLLLDLDKFKNFNDKYGHVQGDYVLLRLGHVIKRSLREIDSAYRYGGEEFTIMLPTTSSEEGIVTAKRIQTELRKENFSLALGQEVYVTVSIGLAQYKPKEEMKAFVHRVDQLMYQAKKNGRDRICPES
ncbi:MAG: PAS domain S-box protein [Smithella sp.]|jgi:diguanylate cyclase (GGDEF)-like protein/PAS domain S-box-containing protein